MSDQATRRLFLQVAGAGAAALALASALGREAGAAPKAGTVPRRPLGKTGVTVSALGLGGYHIGSAKDEKEAARIVHEAMESGVDFMDNAWEYHDGKSEEWMGKALVGRRPKAFLMTKVCTHGRDADVAMKQLEDSLRRLETDYLDLWQIHEVVYDNDPELIFRKNGAIEALSRAKKQGKVRFVGFTGHKNPSIHLEVLSHNYPFDTVQLPLNALDATYRSFEDRVLPELARQGIAALGMKSLGSGRAVSEGAARADELLRYAMSLPVATTISGIDSIEVLRKNLGVARDLKPMTPGEMRALRARLAPVAADGRFELYKSTNAYDGPIGRAQHGFPPPGERGG